MLALLDAWRDALATQPLGLLFLTIGIGAVAARLHVRGVGLGVASVLFVGLALGAWGGRAFELPPVVGQFGLVLFVYAIGLEAGGPFLRMARRYGLPMAAIAIAALLPAAGAAWLACRWLGVAPELATGLFCGAGTNTPALAAVTQHLAGSGLAGLPTVGYALAYPLGVILPLAMAEAALRWRRVDLAAQVRRAEAAAGVGREPAASANLVVEAEGAVGHRLGTGPLVALPVRVSRVQHDGHVAVPTAETVLERGDVLHVVGPAGAIADARAAIGPEATGPAGPEDFRAEVDFRRIILSNHALVGRRVDDLGFDPAWEAIVTRVRRGDLDFVPARDTVLELGDRLRVVARADRLADVGRHLGDSFRALGEIDLVPLAAGLALGMAVGALRVPLPGGLAVQLGAAGGPLVVALVLGALGRTGPVIWRLPPPVSLALRQLGLVLFFASVGLRAGHEFTAAFTGVGLALVGLGGLATALSTVALVGGTRRLLGLDWVSALGALAGGQTQPALLAFAEERSHSEVADVAYASILPTAMVAKIVLAQLLLVLLRP